MAAQRLLRHGGLILLGIGLAVGICEAALRVMFPRMVGSYQGLYTLSESTGYHMKPRLDVVYRTGEYTTRIRSNEWGFRDVPHATAKPAGTVRILVLGDSMTEALQVPFEETFHQRLIQRLRETGDRPYELVCMAVGGFSPIQEYAVWRAYGRDVTPDLVLLALTPNDFAQLEGLSLPPSDAELRQRVQSSARSLYGHPLSRAYRSLYLYSFVRNTLWQTRWGKHLFDRVQGVVFRAIGSPPQPPGVDLWSASMASAALSASQQRSWDDTVKLIVSLAEEIEATGSRCLVMMIPFREHVDPMVFGGRPDPHRPAARFAHQLKRHGISSVALDRRFRTAHGSGRPLYFRYDPHLTSFGHQVVAEALMDHMKF